VNQFPSVSHSLHEGLFVLPAWGPVLKAQKMIGFANNFVAPIDDARVHTNGRWMLDDDDVDDDDDDDDDDIMVLMMIVLMIMMMMMMMMMTTIIIRMTIRV
jgi:hypothetical protein